MSIPTNKAFTAAGQQWLNKTFGSVPRITKTAFSLRGLNDGVLRTKYGTPKPLTFDHMQYVKWGSFPFAIISHPYSTKDQITEDMRKFQHTHPKLVALFLSEVSWWNDGCVPYIVILRDIINGTAHSNFTWGTYCVTRSENTNRRRGGI
jgi:hypothetical protein